MAHLRVCKRVYYSVYNIVHSICADLCLLLPAKTCIKCLFVKAMGFGMHRNYMIHLQLSECKAHFRSLFTKDQRLLQRTFMFQINLPWNCFTHTSSKTFNVCAVTNSSHIRSYRYQLCLTWISEITRTKHELLTPIQLWLKKRGKALSVKLQVYSYASFNTISTGGIFVHSWECT